MQGKGPGETALPPYCHYSGDSFDRPPLAEVPQTCNGCASKRPHALKLGSPIQFTPSRTLTIDPYAAPANNGILCEPSQDIPITSLQQNGQDCHPQLLSSTLGSFPLPESQTRSRSPTAVSSFGFEVLNSGDSTARATTTTDSCIIGGAVICDGQVHPSHKPAHCQQPASYCDGVRPTTERDPRKKYKRKRNIETRRRCEMCFKNFSYTSRKTSPYICRACREKEKPTGPFSYPCHFATSRGCSATFQNRQDADTHARVHK